MNVKKIREVEYYVMICDVCGKEIEVHKESKMTTCYDCREKVRLEERQTKLDDMFCECKIISINRYHDEYRIESFIVQNEEGKQFKFFITSLFADDFNYITYEELEDSKFSSKQETAELNASQEDTGSAPRFY